MSSDSSENENASRLRQRLWGAAVLIALAVLVLPLILDGAGSESQFRQVERLREEPVVKINAPVAKPASTPEETSVEVSNIQTPSRTQTPSSNEDAIVQTTERENPSSSSLTAWVVQAAALSKEEDALELRDTLRRAGFASFVRDRDAKTDPFRVLVGPMIKQQSAEKERQRVAELLKNDPILLTYP